MTILVLDTYKQFNFSLALELFQSPNPYVIKFDIVWELLGCVDDLNLIQVFNNSSFIENTHYIYVNLDAYITYECLMKFCSLLGTEESLKALMLLAEVKLESFYGCINKLDLSSYHGTATTLALNPNYITVADALTDLGYSLKDETVDLLEFIHRRIRPEYCFNKILYYKKGKPFNSELSRSIVRYFMCLHYVETHY